MRIINSYLFITALLVISSCGYQLRGPVAIEGLENVTIISNGYTSVSRLLAQRLGSQVTSYSIDDKNYPIIKINSMSNQKDSYQLIHLGEWTNMRSVSQLILN